MSLSSLSLDAFYTCAQLAHFTRAAERLNITQSALSQRIKNLEDELGLTLFIRDRAGLKLTEAGERLLRYCQTKEALEQEVLTGIQGSQSQGEKIQGVIRIGGYSSVTRSLLLPALKKLVRKHPVQLKVVTRELYELPRLFQSGEIDFMLLDHTFEKDGVAAEVLGHEKNVLVQKKDYQGPEVFLDHDEEDTTTLRFFKGKNKSEVRRHYLDDVQGIIDGVRMGWGKAVLPSHLVQEYSDIEVLDAKRVLQNPVVLHFYQQPFYTKLHQEVQNLLKTEIPSLLGN